MGFVEAKNNPAMTYTLEDFVAMQDQDDLTYANLSIARYWEGVTFAEDNIMNYYMDELQNLCTKVNKIYFKDTVRYRYAPDLLSYDLYKTTQLDFIILLCNGIIDYKDFDMKQNYIYAPHKNVIRKFLSRIYNAEGKWIEINRTELKESMIEEMNKGGG